MKISQIILKGFRNFKNATINFSNNTLVIGSNDVGKTNLLYAMRLLLDRSLSEMQLEPKDSDFYIHDNINEFSITIKFEEVLEDCIKSRLGKYISDKDELYIKYEASRDVETKVKSYKFYASHINDQYQGLISRYYTKVINLKYISSNRDLGSFIRREKKNLIQDAKEKSSGTEKEEDRKTLVSMESNLEKVDKDLGKLSFIKNATISINSELEELSFKNQDHKIVFDAGTSDTSKFIDDVQLVSRVQDKNIEIGGDGRNNQIFLALWATQNEVAEENPIEVTIYAIEEPEAHLHPHQQRKLAEYLSSKLKNQVIITTHSPQITSEFSPNSIIRLYEEENKTYAANNGCAEIIEKSFINFGHRLNIVPAEAFFSGVVFLVEGPSEVLFYKALANKTGIDLDKLNISILMVDGVGFSVFIKLLDALKIKWVLRTDNDIFKIKEKEEYRFAGVQRAVDFYRSYCKSNKKIDKIISENEEKLSGFTTISPPTINTDGAEKISTTLKDANVFLSINDLEEDLLNSEIKEEIIKFLGKDDEEIKISMKKRKATFMYNFLLENNDCLDKLKFNKICEPLNKCREIIER